MDQSKAPLFEALIAHQHQKPFSFHVPGHKNGLLFSKDAIKMYQDVLKVDLTELTGLDDLHQPSGVIKEAETLAAQWYRSKRCFFLVGGSTVGNLAMVMATCKEGDTVLVQRNSHKSIINALRLAKVTPIFLQPSFDEEAQISTVLEESFVVKCINDYQTAKALIITNPNYYGYTMELQAIIREAHKHNIAVLVDEAHGAHFAHSSKLLPKSAINYGADIVVQSAHKTLPAMTMSSYLHFNSDRIDINKLHYYLQMFQSSSPSYPLMASLDLARQFLATLSEAEVRKTVDDIRCFKEYIKSIPQLSVIENKHYLIDPLKVTIQSNCNFTGYQLQQLLEEESIFSELADKHNILLVMPLLIQINLLEVAEKIKKKLIKYAVNEPSKKIKRGVINQVTSLALSYAEMDELESENIALEEAIGSIISEEITPYPPGVPLLLRGEKVEKDHLNQLSELKLAGAYFQGRNIFEDGVKVFKHS